MDFTDNFTLVAVISLMIPVGTIAIGFLIYKALQLVIKQDWLTAGGAGAISYCGMTLVVLTAIGQFLQPMNVGILYGEVAIFGFFMGTGFRIILQFGEENAK